MILIDSVAIRNILIARQLNIKDFAQMAKIPPSTASHLARDDKKVTFKTVGKITAALNIEPEEIIKNV